MKRRYRLLAPLIILSLALALPLPVAAKSGGHGRGKGKGHSSESRSGRSDDHGGAKRVSSNHGSAHRWESGGGESWKAVRQWNGGGDRSARSQRSGKTYARSYRTSGDYGGRTYVRYASYSGPRYSHHACRSSYYVDGFYRPAFVSSGFSLGFVIASAPVYGYGYYDPYCGVSFATIDDYSYHCGGLGHPSALLMLDIQSGYAVATCGYHGGSWVVDDCY